MATAAYKCPRSLWEILIAATSTAAFIAAANFGFAPNISSKAGTWARWFQCLKMELGEPFRTFGHSLLSAVISWHTLSSNIYELPNIIEKPAAATGGATYSTGIVGSLQKIREELKRKVTRIGIVGIMLNCPLLIRIPQEFPLKAAEDPSECDKKNTRKVKMSEPSWMSDLKIVRDIHAWNPLELPPLVQYEPQPAAGAADVDVAHINISLISSQHKPLYIKLHPSLWGSKGIEERTLLLKLNLVPKYEQLRYLRSRSTFEAVVTTVQSFGYMLGVAQRIIMKLRVSPLEAIMAFFNLLIVLQFILNLYACVHYQRPLLLRLSLEQFTMYSEAHTKTSHSASSPSTSKLTRAVFLVSLISVAFYAFIQFAFIRYALSNLHRCILCSVSAFLLCLLGLSALILIGLFSFPGFRSFWKDLHKKVKVHYAFRICTSIISTSSTILALVATIISWSKFKEPTTSLLKWLVPYVNNN